MKPVNKFLFILVALFCLPQLHALDLSSPSAINPNRLSDRFGKEKRTLTANQSPMFEWDAGGKTFTSFDLKLSINNPAIVLPPGWQATAGRNNKADETFKFKVGKNIPSFGSNNISYFMTTSLGQGIPSSRDANGDNVPSVNVSFTDVSTLTLPAFYAGNSEGLKFDFDIKETDADLQWVSTEVKLMAREVGGAAAVLIKSDTYATSFTGPVTYDLSKDSTNRALDENKKYEFMLVVTTTKGGKELPAGMTLEAFNSKYANDGAVIKISNMVLKDSKANTFTSSNAAEDATILEVHGIPGTVDYLPEDLNALVTSGTFTYKKGDGTIVGTAAVQNSTYYPMFDPYTGPDSRTERSGLTIKCQLIGHTSTGVNEEANLSLTYSGVSQSDVVAPVITDVKAPFPAVSNAEIEFTSDEAGVAYYVAIPEVMTTVTPTTSPIAEPQRPTYAYSQPTVVDKSDFPPSAIQIISGRDFLYNPAIVHGQITMVAGVNKVQVSGLDPAKEYEVYIAVRDLQGNINLFSNRWFQLFCPSAIDGRLPIFYGAMPPKGPDQGLNISPMMFWKGVPKKTHHFKLVMHNLDAKNRLHWNVTNIPYDPITKTGTNLPEDIATNPVLGATFAKQYEGPYSGVGLTQRYKFVLSAFDSSDKLLSSCDLTLNFTNRVEADTLSPAIYGVDVHSPLTDSNHTFSFVPLESATAYWVVLEDSLPVPTKAQIIAGLDPQYNAAAYKGNLKVEARKRATVTVPDLETGKNYNIYVAVRDKTGNIVVITNHAVGLTISPVTTDVVSTSPLTVVTGKVITVKVKLDSKPLNTATIKPFDNPDIKFYTESLTFDTTNYGTEQDFTFVVRNPSATSAEIKFGIAEGYSYIDSVSNAISLIVQPVNVSGGGTNLNFQKGWNLIGVPYIDLNRDDFGFSAPADSDLADLWSKINLFYRYDLTLTGGEYKPFGDTEAVPIRNSANLTSRRGYWVFISDHLKNPNVVVNGVRDNQPIVDFSEGNFGITGALSPFRDWVLVSVAENYAANRISNKIGLVWKWDQFEQAYVQVSDDEDLKPGVGYWVFAFMKK